MGKYKATWLCLVTVIMVAGSSVPTLAYSTYQIKCDTAWDASDLADGAIYCMHAAEEHGAIAESDDSTELMKAAAYALEAYDLMRAATCNLELSGNPKDVDMLTQMDSAVKVAKLSLDLGGSSETRLVASKTLSAARGLYRDIRNIQKLHR